MHGLFEGVGIALGSLRANKVRASLTILGVGIGVAVVMAIASMVHGINAGVTEIFEQMGPRTFFVFRYFQGGINISDGSDEMSPWRRNPPLSLAELDRIADLPTVGLAVVGEDGNASVEYGSETLSSVQVYSRGTRWLEVSGGDVYPGRSFTQLEQEASARVAVVTTSLAEQLFGRLDPVGRRLKIAGDPYQVIGVYSPPPDLFGDSERPAVYLPHNTFDKKIPHFRGWMNFFVKPAATATVQETIDDVTGALRSARGLRPAEESNFSIVTQDKMLETWNNMTGVVFAVMIALSSVGLMVGGVGVIAIMMISVTERTREIGVRKALGARRRAIMWQFLIEAATLTAVGGAFGMMLGGGVSVLVRTLTPLPAEVPALAVVVALGASVGTGIFFGLYPAAKAARLDPVEALRHE